MQKERPIHRGRKLMVFLLAFLVACSMMPASVFGASKAKPAAPKKLSVKKIEKNRTIKASWKKYRKSAKTEVQLKEGKKKYKTVAKTKKSSTVIKKLKTNTDYRVRVRTLYKDRKSAFRYVKKAIRFTEKKSNGGNSGENENNGGSSGSQAERSKNDLVINEKTGIRNLGFAQFLKVSYQDGYDLDNTKLIVDGVDVTEAATKVTDDGSAAKWEITSLNPAKLTVESKTDPSKKESVRLSSNQDPEKPVVKKNTAPGYMIAHASVSIFDYYLTNYDNDGNVKVRPAKTTFSGKSQKTPHIKYYVSEAELKEGGNSGRIVIMFNYTSKEDKAWFNSIEDTGALGLVMNNEQQASLNDQLAYTKTTADHNGSTVGEIIIPVPQTNFTNNGRYLIRVKSKGHQTCMASVNLVNEQAPTIKLKESSAVKPGQNVHFQIDNMIHGAEEPVEHVFLTDPDGVSSELAYIDDYFLYGNTGLFVLYNDTERNDGKGVNHTKKPGVYTIRIEAAGFKPVEKKFTVTSSGVSALVKSLGSKLTFKKAAKVDTISGATGMSGGSGSGSSGGGAVSADLKFDGDLLINALLLDGENDAATAIANRWEAEITSADYVSNANGTKMTSWMDYYDAVSEAALNGRYLSFADYISDPGTKLLSANDGRPSKVKAVLEDNLLGDLDNDYLGTDAPKLTLTNENGVVKEGEDAVFSCSDAEYLKSISGIYESEDDYYSISKDKYSVDPEKKTLTIKASALKLGEKNRTENDFVIRSIGYRKQNIKLAYEKQLEKVTLSLRNENMQTGDDAVIDLNGSEGDFLKNLSGAELDGNALHTKSEAGTSGNDWYEISGDRKSLTIKGGKFKEAREYQLTLKAKYYDDLTLSFNVSEKKDDPAAAGAPAKSKIEYDSNKIKVFFEGDETAVEKYLEKLTSVKVDGKYFDKGILGTGNGEYLPVQKSSTNGGAYCILELGMAAPEQDIQVELKAEGYKTQTFTIQPKKAEEPSEPDPSEAKEMNVLPDLDENATYQYGYLGLKSDRSEYAEWLKNIEEVQLNDVKLEKNSYTWSADSYGITNSYAVGTDPSMLIITSSNIEKSKNNNLVIKAKGYKDVTWTITRTESGNYFGPDKYTIESIETVK